jgi:predicted MPP superfamily phosphohydrolase
MRMTAWRLAKVRIRPARALLLLALVAVGIAVGAKAWRDTTAEPVVRRVSVVLPGMGAGAKPVTIALLSDTHVAEPNVSPARLSGIVEQINALRPDIVVLAGDYLSERTFGVIPYPAREAVAPLAALRAPLGVYAVMGNHDHWHEHSTVGDELTRQGLTVLVNQARKVGPLALGGLGDAVSGQGRLDPTLAEMRRIGGGQVIVSHTPDPFARLPADTGLMLAGHTHCGQIRFVGWAPITNSRYGGRYACGVIRERGNLLVVTAGIGTTILPVRFGAVPDIWLIEVRPKP